MARISAAEYRKRLGKYADLACREPVTVTRRGRPAFVLLAADEFARLRRVEERTTRAIRTSDLPEATLAAMRSADLDHLSQD